MVKFNFAFRHEPFAHQLAELERSCELPARGLLWEMGTGKSCPTIQTAAHLYLSKKITGMLVLAPDGIHTNWLMEGDGQIDEHLPKAVGKVHKLLWQTSKSKQVGYGRTVKAFLEERGGFAILASTYDAIMTEAGSAAIKKFLDTRRCLYVLDESLRIKTPSAKRARRVLASAKYAPFRRILTGTPIDNSPFDIFMQLKFIDENCWNEIGCNTFSAFKATFGIWQKVSLSEGRQFDKLVSYKNLDLLKQIVDKYCSRLMKSDVLKHLPQKLYKRRTFELNSEQRRVYNDLRTEYMSWLAGGGVVTAELAITRMIRMQQITSGYIPADQEKDLRLLGEKNPRLETLVEALEDVPGKAIIWGKYDIDIDTIAQRLRADGHKVVTYDGRTPDEDRVAAVRGFQNGDARYFVAKPSAAGEGLTLTAAHYVVYYNNSFRLGERQQSEDRAHRIGQKNAVTYIDIVAEDSIDEYILKRLRSKRDVASQVTGDKLESWI